MARQASTPRAKRIEVDGGGVEDVEEACAGLEEVDADMIFEHRYMPSVAVRGCDLVESCLD